MRWERTPSTPRGIEPPHPRFLWIVCSPLYIVSSRSEPLRSEQPRPCWKLELHVEDSIVLCSRPRALLSHTNRVHVRIARNGCSKGDAGF